MVVAWFSLVYLFIDVVLSVFYDHGMYSDDLRIPLIQLFNFDLHYNCRVTIVGLLLQGY